MQEINLITNRLESARIPYCIVGGLAAIAYGRPRLTLDADPFQTVRSFSVGSANSDFSQNGSSSPRTNNTRR